MPDNEGRYLSLRESGDLLFYLTYPAITKDGQTSFPIEDQEKLAEVSGYRTFRQVALGAHGDLYEGPGEYGNNNYTIMGLGIRARLPFPVFILPGLGSQYRLAVDVAHRW